MKTRMTLTFALAFSILLCSVNAANATTYLVTNTNSTGAGSLSQAILDANANAGADTIDVTGVTGTIDILSQQTISESVTVNGPGAALLNVHGVATFTEPFRVFYVTNGAVTFFGFTISGGYIKVFNTDWHGAGIRNAGELNITECIVSGNTLYSDNVDGFAGLGAGIYNSGTLTITNSLVTNNTGFEGSGGGSLTAARGGGIYNIGTASINNCTVSSNSDNGGGGIANDGSIIITNSTISNNTAGGGGGINQTGGSVTITNSTISGNMAVNGGGIKYGGGVSCSIVNTTVTGNDGYGGGLYVSNGSPSISNSILAGNTNSYNPNVGVDYYGTNSNPTSLGHNICSKDENGIFTGSGDQAGSYVSPIDPLLGPLADNGGPTFTHALLTGSPAINTGTCVTSTDQRGIARPQGVTCDVGSYEDIAPHASIADKSMLEGNSGITLMKFKVTLDHAYGGTVKIKYATADSTATAGSDYVAATGTVAFKPGVISKSISITINGDVIVEPNERFKVKLSKPTNAVLLDSLSIGTIKNDDVAPTASTINNNKIDDGAGVKIMPDPSKGNFTIQMQLPEKEAATTLMLYNSLGLTVWQQDLGSVGGPVTKNVYLENKLVSGVYLLMVKRSDMQHTAKIVIRK